jgi:rRNA maturation endonuclease Nob1
MCWVRVSAGAKVLWTTVTVVTDHGALQNTAESIKMQFAAIRIRILSVYAIRMYFSTYQVLDFY